MVSCSRGDKREDVPPRSADLAVLVEVAVLALERCRESLAESIMLCFLIKRAAATVMRVFQQVLRRGFAFVAVPARPGFFFFTPRDPERRC